MLRRPNESTLFLLGRRPASAGPNSGEQAMPPGKPIVSFEINRDAASLVFNDPAPGRPALLGVKTIGHIDGHDALEPVGRQHVRPFVMLPKPPAASDQSMPNPF